MDVHLPFAAGRLRLQHEDGVAVLHLGGEIDMAAVLAFETTVGAATGCGGIGAVDASAVTFMSCAGISCMLRATAALRDSGRRPLLRNPSWPVLRVLELTGQLDAFDIVDDRLAPG